MRKTLILLLLALCQLCALAEERTIDISGNNTSSNYVSYNQYISLYSADILHVKMARYCYFSSTIVGSGVLNLYAGGERCYLGTEKGKTWPNWSGYTGDIHIWPFEENSPSAGFYGVVLAHGGKTCSPEAVDDGLKSGKVNTSMENNRVWLHTGATICCEAHTSGSMFRIGELQMESGSRLQGYMKNSRAAYYLLGGMNTDGLLAGTLAPSDYRDDTLLGLIKEGTGTYTITGNNNYLNGGLRIAEGRVLVMNDRQAAESNHLRGALGAKADNADAVAYVFEQGVLGGTGSIGGTVDNYGTVEPGNEAAGVLTLKNYAADKEAHLYVHPASVLSFRVAGGNSNRLDVDGQVKYFNSRQDFTTSDKMPLIRVAVANGEDLQIGNEFRVLTARGKTGDWHFDVLADKYTWEVFERQEDGNTVFVVRLVSFDDMTNPDNPDDPDNPVSTIGAFYDDGIDDGADQHTLRYYAAENGKRIGTAISMWKNDLNNENLGETKEVGQQFNMLVAENEMKFDALEPSRGNFNFGSGDALVAFAQKHDMMMRGHCLAWHSQLPEWVSSDGKKNDKNWTRAEALQILKNHIEKVVQHYRGKVAEWDVVNECLDDDQSIVRTHPESYQLRQSVWTLAIGEDFIDSAFVYAHRADPQALLYLNDYDVEMKGKAKTIAFYNLARRLLERGIPIHGVGLQCHFSIGDVDSVKLNNNIRQFGELGLKCIITELDMGIPDTSAPNLEEQARGYRVVTDIMLNNDNCPHAVIWGLKDNNSWRESSSPLLYTAGLGKKPAWYAVRSALRHRVLVNTAVERPSAHVRISDDTVYDLMGRRITSSSLRPGIYIKGGKKILITSSK
ncbi:MAG: endo-1,4-beta-xylanase [Prevotella sp.]|nr:endo-1,4-beta-xylanase [Prevotella sp.]